MHDLVQPHDRFRLEFFAVSRDHGKFAATEMLLWPVHRLILETTDQCTRKPIDHLKIEKKDQFKKKVPFFSWRNLSKHST